MKTPAPTAKQLRQENAELRARLAEAEETLDAIRTGAVDAVVAKDQVYTLHGAETPYRLLIEAMNEGAVVLRADGTILYCNDRFAKLLGTPLQNLIGSVLRRYIVPAEQPAFDALLAQGREHSSKGEVSFHCQSATVTLVQLSFSVLDVQGAHGVCIVATDLTERKQAEEALQQAHATLEQRVIERTEKLLLANAALHTSEQTIEAALAEKEVLLKEIHHRVKNNLQIIVSLVNLQADGVTDERVLAEFAEIGHRVRAMALVHETLYQAPDLAQLNFADYTNRLLHQLWRAHAGAAGCVRLNVTVPAVGLPVDTAVTCGLLLNELASNTLKHAFPAGRSGTVTVALDYVAATRAVCLRVQDDGVGLPAGLDWRQSKSLGLRLVNMLAGQLRGTVETAPGAGPGTEFRVNFTLP